MEKSPRQTLYVRGKEGDMGGVGNRDREDVFFQDYQRFATFLIGFHLFLLSALKYGAHI